MKEILVAILVVAGLLGSLGLSGCSGQGQPYTDSTQVVNTGVGQEFTIALESNISTGYSWQAKFDPSILNLVNNEYKAGDTTGMNVVGSSGTQYFYFKPVKSGQAVITFTYYRPWETPTAQDQVQNFNVNVK